MQIRTEVNASIAIAVMWVLILVTSVPAYLMHGVVSYNFGETEHSHCIFLEVDTTRPDGWNQPTFRVSLGHRLLKARNFEGDHTVWCDNILSR